MRVHRAYKQGSDGSFNVWTGSFAEKELEYPAQDEYYVCFGHPSDGYSGFWVNDKQEAIDLADELAA